MFNNNNFPFRGVLGQMPAAPTFQPTMPALPTFYQTPRTMFNQPNMGVMPNMGQMNFGQFGSGGNMFPGILSGGFNRRNRGGF